MASSTVIQDYSAAQAFLLGRIDYERTPTIPYQEHHLKLQRMRDLLDHLGNPARWHVDCSYRGKQGKGIHGDNDFGHSVGFGSTSRFVHICLTFTRWKSG